MFRLLCKKLLQNSVHTALDSAQFSYSLHKNHSFILASSFSSISASISTINQQNEQAFTISYLIHSCGLSKDAAKSASRKLHLKTKEKPDSVLELFRNYGLNNTQVTSIITKCPNLLVADPDKTLKPKFEFFSSVRALPADINKIFILCPSALHRSLEKHTIPSFVFLKSLLQTNCRVIQSLKRSPWLLRWDLQNSVAPNIIFLRNYGVPESLILHFLKGYGSALATNPVRFEEVVEEIKDMGFDPLKGYFLKAIYVRNLMNKVTWERKWEVFRKWGWSDDEILSEFRKYPIVLLLSEEKFERVMDFLVKVGLNSSDFATYPQILCHNLDKRIIPRCSVIQMLRSKGLLMRSFKASTVLTSIESRFIDMFVTKYQEEVPELWNYYQNNAYRLGSNIQFKGRIFA